MYLLPEKWFLEILELAKEVIVFQDRLFYLSEVSVFSCSLSPPSVVKHPWDIYEIFKWEEPHQLK